jgi:hypothetical protein
MKSRRTDARPNKALQYAAMPSDSSSVALGHCAVRPP